MIQGGVVKKGFDLCNVDLKKRRARMPGCGTRNRMMLVAVLAALLAGAVSEVDMGDDIGDDVVGDEIVGGGDEIVGEKKVGGGEAPGPTRNKGPQEGGHDDSICCSRFLPFARTRHRQVGRVAGVCSVTIRLF